jgi:NADH:ubiquinone oxidoreductase subunit D
LKNANLDGVSDTRLVREDFVQQRSTGGGVTGATAAGYGSTGAMATGTGVVFVWKKSSNFGVPVS